jgi:pilus assembly protein Flp/PilA
MSMPSRPSLSFKSRTLLSRSQGQGLVEYALILVFVAIVTAIILLTMGHQIQNVFSNVITSFQHSAPANNPNNNGNNGNHGDGNNGNGNGNGQH